MFSTAFTANLYSVMTNEGPEIYRDPVQFFGMTYATETVKELAKDVLRRLAGKTDRAVHQLERTYGGGKTHAEILLRHLVHDPTALPPDSQALREILVRAEVEMDAMPRARVAALPFDYLDPAKGIEVRDPDGNLASFRFPWNAIAWQIGGDKGLETIGSNRDDERDDAPYTNVLTELFRLPEAQGLGTLILLDEVLMWAREYVGTDDDRLDRLRNFFQRLSEAVKAVNRCCLVVSLLAHQIDMMDVRGQSIMEQLYAALRRQGEVGITPIAKEDVAEVLRRRFFEPDSIRDREAFRPSVRYALQGITVLDDQTARRMNDETKRYLDSFPFHPDLIDVLYQKWTGLKAFQQARGVLQTFALALRDAEAWDPSPLVGVNVFLTVPDKIEPGKEPLSPAAQDLTNIARQQAIDDVNPDWPKIIEGELSKARRIQDDFPDLKTGREAEQAVFAIFLHSEPQPSEKARTRELMALLGHTNPDKIVLGRALERLARTSWFLDEATLQDVQATPGGDKRLPETWRYGFQFNLRAMHDSARERVEKPTVEAELENAIGKVDSLTRGAKQAGAAPHLLPGSPYDVDDDGLFRYVVVGPKAASESGRPSAEAVRYLEQYNGPDYPRKFGNAILVVAPSRDGLINARERVRDVIAWRSVKEELKQQDRNFEENAPQRAAKLEQEMREAEAAVPNAIRVAYCIVITRGMAGDVQAFKINSVPPGNKMLFQIIKEDARSRIQETPISAEALMPGGQYDLWEAGEDAHRVAD
ncbi:MAG TPA: DUF499 domain-containing protein, partial [Dehalococcoidia bacterium]|nr:DUF499 domain-containing protein [Dehalococcoidia bacterium]